MTVREYIGARYVPLFMGDWDIDADYEPLSVVTYQGDSYTSRQSVPHGIEITNTAYWAVTGNYNAQVEAYRAEVRTLEGEVTENTADIAQNTSDIEQNTNDIAQNTSDISQNASDILVINQSIAELKGGTEMVIIGDSFSVDNNMPTNEFWWSKLSQKLNLTPHNYSANGCAFKRGNQTFATQISNAASDSTFDNSDVEMIIIFGGVNDCYTSFNEGEYANLVSSAITLAKTSFPNAQVVVAGINTFHYVPARSGYNLGTVTVTTLAQTLQRALTNVCGQFSDVLFIPFLRKMVAREDLFSSAYNGHPTPNGQTFIACVFYNYLRGSGYNVEKRYILVNPIYGTGNIAFWFDEYKTGFYANSVNTLAVTDDVSHSLVPIPLGLDGFLFDTLMSVPCGIAGRPLKEKTPVTWITVLDYNHLPTWSGVSPLPEYSQAFIDVAAPVNEGVNMRIHSIGEM